MPKWKIGAQFNNATVGYVTFTANTSLTGYRIIAYSFGKTAAATVSAVVAFPNVINDDGTTATLYSGAPAVGGDCMLFPEDGFIIKADQNTFVTLTMSGSATGTLAIAYDLVTKQP